MRYWICLSALLLLMGLCVFTFVACGDETSDAEGDPPNTEVSAPDSEEEETPALLDPAQAYILADNKTTQYVVIRDDAASSEVRSAINEFRNAFWAKTGADIQVMDDTTRPLAKEIIISMMDERDEPEQELSKLTAPEKKGYRVTTVGEKIVVASTEEYLSDALALLTAAISDCGNGMWGIPQRYEGKMDIPAMEADGELYNVGEGNYAYNVPKVTAQFVDRYVETLERDGFTLYAQNTIGSSQFKTYIKDNAEGNMVVYLMYHPEIHIFRLTYGPMEYLPNVTPVEAAGKVDPTITQIYMQTVYADLEIGAGNVVTANNCAPGMSYLLQLSDGRFIIIDGGKADGEIHTVKYDATTGRWIASANSLQSSDAQRLYDTMKAMKPADHDRPQIAAWLISHAHGDHMNLAQKFLEDYTGRIELELVAFNFPETTSANLGTVHRDLIRKFRDSAEKTFGANVWIMHTGQVMELPDARIEVLSTVEDFYCEGLAKGLTAEIDLNNTCAVFRVTMGDVSFMVLGDAYQATCQFMADAYGDTLQSDILQISHHGFNGAVLALYQAIDPKICFWPCDEYRFMTGSSQIGSQNGYYNFNWWLRNKPWTRGAETGERTHYAASYTTTVNVRTGKIVTSN